MIYAADLEGFLREVVNLDQGRLDRLQDRVHAIDDFLATSSIRDIYIDVIPAGSWAHRTIIKPVDTNDTFDADVLLLVDEQTDWDAKEYLDEVHRAFRGSGTYKNMVGVEPKTRCVRVDYADDFHIDVVPYMERHSENYITNRVDPPDTGSFELSNPEGFTEWVDERQRLTNNHFIKVVRLIKYLRDYKNTFSCKSIILKTLLGNAISQVDVSVDPACYKDLSTALKTIVRHMADALPETMPAVMDPGGTGDNFSDRYPDWNYANFRTWMRHYATQIEEAYDCDDAVTSTDLWRKIFGPEFKASIALSASASESLSSSAPIASEQFIDQAPFNHPVQLDPAYSARINGRVTGWRAGQTYRRNGFRQFTLAKQGNRVPKNRSLRFTLTTNVPSPYIVFWKVKNGGSEAKDSGDQRGEITADDGGQVRVETTSYAGRHFVEAYVIKGGVVVARDHHLVEVTAR